MDERIPIVIGMTGIGSVLLAGLLWAPSVSNTAFSAPDAQRIFYWHVPAAWAAMVAFAGLFIGSLLWFIRRSEFGWRLHVASSEAGLAFGLMATFSGCIWGAAEWGTPWDWTDVRLNTFALLTLLSLFLVITRRGHSDGVEARDTFSTFGMYGFALVPITYMATRWWQIRHPGPVIATNEGSLNSDMGLLLALGGIFFTVLVIGHIMASMKMTRLEQRLEVLMKHMDEGAI